VAEATGRGESSSLNVLANDERGRDPLRNRVTPRGEIIAVAARGTLMGNRGILHNARGEIVRDWQVRRWIACQLEFRGRHRQVMTPGSYTELFFLDEAVALADGHRPCAECRHAEYVAFQAAWKRAFPRRSPPPADSIDRFLHSERRTAPRLKRTHQMEMDELPDATYIQVAGGPWLVLGDTLLAWSPVAYIDRQPRWSGGLATVLTPPSIVAALHAGYGPGIHASAR